MAQISRTAITKALGQTFPISLTDSQRLINIIYHCPISVLENKWQMKITQIPKGWMLMKDGVRLLSPSPLFFHVGLSDFEGKWERHFTIAKGDTCLDVGACIGDTAVPMIMKTGEDGAVIAVEPHPLNVEYLRKNLAGYSNAIIIEKALGCTKGSMTLHTHADAVTGHSLLPHAERVGSVMVEVDTLDNLLGDSVVDFAKVDVMGSEVDFLYGATRFLRKVKRLAIQTHYWMLPEATYPKVVGILQGYGFKFLKFDVDNGVVYASRD